MEMISILFGLFFVIASCVFLGIGIPFLISGIINTIKLNRKISIAKREMNNTAYTQPQNNGYYAQQQYVPQQPQMNNFYSAPQQQYTPQPQPQPQPQPTYVSQQQYANYNTAQSNQSFNSNANQESVNSGFIDLDWQKYAPLNAGVSYDKSRDYKFHRAEGFAGSVPQTFVNRTFPKCPICCSSDPYWTISQHNQMSWKGNLYLFKCSRCEGIISMSMPDVTTLGNGSSGVVANPNVGLTNLMAKASSGKEAGAVYAVIESVGHSGVTPECEGKEFKLEQMQDMFLRQ
jgi:hypothetical protein